MIKISLRSDASLVNIDTMDLFNDAMKYADKSHGKVENSTKYSGD